MSVSLLAVALTATFGAAAGFGVSAWRELQRVGQRLNFTNPDTNGYRAIPLTRAMIAGAFLGAATGTVLSAAYSTIQDAPANTQADACTADIHVEPGHPPELILRGPDCG